MVISNTLIPTSLLTVSGRDSGWPGRGICSGGSASRSAFFRRTSSSFHVWISGNFVNRSMIMLFSLFAFRTYETYLSATCRVEVFGNRTENVRKFDRFQLIQVSWDTRCVECPETLVCWCHRTSTAEIEISFAQHGNNLSFGPSLDVLCVSNDDHFVVPVRIL